MKKPLLQRSLFETSFWVVDISNSFTKYSLCKGRTLQRSQRFPTKLLTRPWIEKTFGRKNLPVVLGSVVPAKTSLFKKMVSKNLHLLTGATVTGIRIEYPKPDQIGPDRLANAIAAYFVYGGPAIVIDFGTAVTFDIVTDQGAYAGGVIAPGLNAMTEYLHEKTALLPAIKIQEPKRAIGKSTYEAMLAGTVYGYQGLVKEILIHLKKELRGKPRIIATGGQADLVTKGIPEIKTIDPLLTLKGLQLFYLMKR